MRAAFLHRARLVTRAPGARNAQGEKVLGAPTAGPWFRCRVMERGGVASKQRRGQNTTDARVARGYELLADFVDLDGGAVTLDASSVVETDCPVLGSPVIKLDGEPELLNSGVRVIGWMAYASRVKDAA